MNKSSKLKCRHCGSDDLYLQQCIITKSDISEDEGGTIIYENGEVYDDEIVEEFTCYRCDNCDRKLTIDNEYASSVVVTEQSLEEYRQKYCSGETIEQTEGCDASKAKVIDKNEYAYKCENGLWYENMETSWGGVCPQCGDSDMMVYNIVREQWKACHDCKVKWLLGSNLMSAWKEMDEEDFRRDYELLKDYRDAKDIYASDPVEEEK